MSRSDTYSLLVLNLTFRTTVDDLYPLFDPYGQVVGIHIPRDSLTGKSRGFAFVRYKYEDEADIAIERLDGMKFDGRHIGVQYAKYGPNAERIHRGRISARARSRSRSPGRLKRYEDRSRSPRRLNRYEDRDYGRRDRGRDRYEAHGYDQEGHRVYRRRSPSGSRNPLYRRREKSRSRSSSGSNDERRRRSSSSSSARRNSPTPQIDTICLSGNSQPGSSGASPRRSDHED